MSNKTNQEIIEQKDREVKAKIASGDFLSHYIIETLTQFAYRYFPEASSAEAENSQHFRVRFLEKGIKEAIKIKNPALRAGIGDLVKRVSREEGPTILWEISLILKERRPDHSGVASLSAKISFAHPEHQFAKNTFVEKTALLPFDDELHLRNTLAKYLEVVCELFE